MPPEADRSRYFPLLRLTLITLFFTGIFLVLDYVVHVKHQISVFISFLILPMIYLLSRQENSRKKKERGTILLGGLNRGFIEGFAIYLIFAGYVFLYYLNDREFFERYDRSGLTLFISLAYTALNVMSVDFFSKRFIQLPLSKNYGPRVAIGLQTAVWLAAHYPESLWLDELMGGVGVWVFLGLTGLVTGISYERTRNVSGLMAGHVLLNVVVAGLAKL